MLRWLYSLLLYLLTPLLFLRLLWRGRRQPEYLQNLAERFGFYQAPGEGEFIWVHAVSVGETRAAQPLIEGIRARWPGYRILLTGMTPTGREAGRSVYGDAVVQVYLPYDYPFAVDRFFRQFSPAFGVLMETEIWPNLLAAARRRQVPVFLTNARLSARSARGYQRFAALVRPAFSALAGVAAQTPADGLRLADLGAQPVAVCGNLKFDVTPPENKLALGQEWRAATDGRSIWLAASTREDEESLILDAWAQLQQPDVLLVIVPRHPQRFDEVAALLSARGLAWQRRSVGLPTAETKVWLGDSMGEMVAYYAMADLALIGGSLQPLGGQNLIEAAACECPVLVGPHTFNFLQATEDAIAAGAARRIADVPSLAAAVDRLLGHKNELAAMRVAAREFAGAHRGAASRMLDFISQRLGQAGR